MTQQAGQWLNVVQSKNSRLDGTAARADLVLYYSIRRESTFSMEMT